MDPWDDLGHVAEAKREERGSSTDIRAVQHHLRVNVVGTDAQLCLDHGVDEHSLRHDHRQQCLDGLIPWVVCV